MNVDAIQSANVVRVVGDQSYSALFADLQLNKPAHARDFDRASDTAAAPHELKPAEGTPQPKRLRIPQPPQPSGPPAQLRQLPANPKLHDKVVVPAHLWPSETCRELGGAGWEATVVRVHAAAVRVAFDHARTRDGRPYEPELLLTSELRVMQP